ncbi:MAG: hypothetical protein QOH06_709 [Acidobacteriota bacterium]|jgi:hypothetical protein|nr:hypothetical protein [Acidobacteriota bacterium]
MKRFLRENGLSLVLFGLFLFTFLFGQISTGFRQYNEDQAEHGGEQVEMGEYLQTGHFLESTMENWESEFLQMFLYILLTAYLYQKGSSESRKLDEENPQDRDPGKSKDNPDAPWPVRKGGLVLKLYENSLALAFLLLFLFAFCLHGVGGQREYNEEQLQHGQTTVSVLGYMSTSRFWFESFQNWQSEFLAIWFMVVLSIWLRQRRSPESKPVDSPHSETGT